MANAPLDARPEPRSMTVGDLTSLVAGVALGYSAVVSDPGFGLFFVPTPMVMLAFSILRFCQGLTLAFAVVALGRVAAYRRMPRAAEWLAILVSASVLAARPEFNVDARVNQIFAAFPGRGAPVDFDAWRWLVAGAACLAIAAGYGLLRLGRRSFPAWLKTLILAGMALLALAGPLWAIGFLGADLVSPRQGFGPGNLAILHRRACVLFAHFPTGVVFGLPATAALLERVARRRWAWDEWAALSASVLVAFWEIALDRGEFGQTWASPTWPAARGLDLAWLIVVMLSCRWILIRPLHSWGRWIEGPAGRDQPTSSGSSPEASAR